MPLDPDQEKIRSLEARVEELEGLFKVSEANEWQKATECKTSEDAAKVLALWSEWLHAWQEWARELLDKMCLQLEDGHYGDEGARTQLKTYIDVLTSEKKQLIELLREAVNYVGVCTPVNYVGVCTPVAFKRATWETKVLDILQCNSED